MTLNPKQFDPGKNPKQLRMLMTAPEIMELVNTSKDVHGSETMDDMWKRKLGESKNRDNLYDSLATRGYRGTPLWISHEDFTQYDDPPSIDIRLMDGHHRVASMAQIDPNAWIPVIHSTWRSMDMSEAREKKANLNKDQFSEEAPKPNGLDGAL